MLIRLEFDANSLVQDTQVAVAATPDRVRRNFLDFLRDQTDVGPIAAAVSEAIEPKPI